ncbi:MAG: kelch repeat-containing protein, partial [Solirubrobacteraceae bacterium]
MGGLTQPITKNTNDVWKYDISTNNWIWMNGPSL